MGYKFMEYIKPEQVGISSYNILKMIKKLDDAGLNMHSVVIARNGKICCDAHWAPFSNNFAHRLYSVTKSFLSVAVGLLVQDGLISLDDCILKYFPEATEYISDEMFKKQTIRDMLMMATLKTDRCWFDDKSDDRVKYYFENTRAMSKTPGTIFNYDSAGSFILGTMVEKITKKTMLEFLRERVFDKIGMSDNIELLKCPPGYSWSDSALIMSTDDLLKFGMFVMNKGMHNGEQILDEVYIEEATKKQIDNCFMGNNTFNNQGYGYQIWRTYDNSFAFMGMGGQEVICVPDKDLICVCTADNQGIDYARKMVYDCFFEFVAREVKNEELPENPDAEKELSDYIKDLKLSVAKGERTSEFEKTINGQEFYLTENAMGIKKVSLSFEADGGIFRYTNAQGDKELRFGMCKNAFGYFPETGYSDEMGTVSKTGHMYKCAASAAWVEEKKLYLKVQIIDKYFGNLHIVFGFNKDNRLGLWMQKNAEAFLYEYEGYASEN